MELQFINPKGLPQPRVYTPVVTARGGKTVYISGQIAQDENGNLVGKGDLAAQARQVWKNLGAALAGAGARFSDLVKINVYVVSYQPAMRATLSQVRSEFVAKDKPPASTLVGVTSLAQDGLLIEIEAVAVVD